MFGDRQPRGLRLSVSMAMAAVCGLAASQARSQIYQWTTDANGDVVQSSTLCPDGGGVSAGALCQP